MERVNTIDSTETATSDGRFYLPATTSLAADGGRVGRSLSRLFRERGDLRVRIRSRN